MHGAALGLMLLVPDAAETEVLLYCRVIIPIKVEGRD